MTYPPGADLYQAVLPGGSVTLTQLFETYYGSAVPQPVSGVTITIAPAGGSPVVGPTSAGITPGDGTAYSFTWMPAASTPPGDYLVTWAAAGQSGQITYTQVVTVAAPPQLTPAPGVYATFAQYQSETGDQYTPVSLVQVALRRASEVIDRAMIAAWYPTDADSMPTDPAVINIFMRATCLQAQFALANNDPANVKSQYATTNVGGVSVTRTASAQGQIFPPLAPAAAQVLLSTGALPGSPMLGW